MADGNNEIALLSDTAIDNPERDRLGYNDFSKQLANTVQAKIPSSEFIIGIYGEWGSGKSTILNFIAHHLEQEENPPLIIRFNPWWFSGQADLIEKFIEQLEAGLGEEDNFGETREKLSKLASALSTVPFSALSGLPAEHAFNVMAQTLGQDSTETDVGSLKNDISEALRESDQRIVVLIDDLDRLTKDEIKQMFRLVKSVADFPNITYILAFDQNVVINALENEQGIQDGEEYLDKIVQLPLHIPTPESESISSLFTDRLIEIVGDDQIVFDENRWQRMYSEGIQPMLDTPRDAVRLSNAVEISYNALEDEVNFADLVGIETLRIFYRNIYEEIRDHQDRFTSQQSSFQAQRQNEEEEDYSDLFPENVSDKEKETVQELLIRLFPRLRDVFEKRHSFSTQDTSRKWKRICHPEMSPFYFRLTLPRGELSTKRIDSTIAASDNADVFAEELISLSEQEGKAERTKAHGFLERFSEHLDEIPEENIESITEAIFLVGDELIAKDSSRGGFDTGNLILFRIILWDLLKRCDRGTRLSLLEEAINKGESVYLPVSVTIAVSQEHGENEGREYDDNGQILNKNQKEELKRITAQKIEELADQRKLLDTPNTSAALYNWPEWSNSDEPTEWAENVVTDDRGLLRFIKQFRNEIRTSSGIQHWTYDILDPSSVEPYMDIEETVDRLEEVDYKELSDEEQRTKELFLRGKEILDDGRDPSDPGSWSQRGL